MPAFLLVPAGDYTIAETWDVVGLAGTGSKSLILKEVFVPEYRMKLSLSTHLIFSQSPVRPLR